MPGHQAPAVEVQSADQLGQLEQLEAACRRYVNARNAVAKLYGLEPARAWDRLEPAERAEIRAGLVAVRRLWESTR